MIRLVEVTKRYGPAAAPAVSGLSLEVASGETCVLVGPSGSGKTTTLKMINRLVEPTSGTILVDGQDVAATDPVVLRRGMGYVIQATGLFPHLSVAGNVATVPRLLGWDRRRIQRRVDELLELVALPPGEFRHRRPEELSGGQRQRVGVARALAADPPILLMDEPFGAVDPVTRARLQDEFSHLQAALHKTVVMVTHDIDEALRLGDRIAVLTTDGRLAQFATPVELLARPASEFVAVFVGAGRTLKRLQLTGVQAAVVPPGKGAGRDRRAPSVAAEASLAGALDALLAFDASEVAVEDEGRRLGVVTFESLRAALHTGGAEAEVEWT